MATQSVTWLRKRAPKICAAARSVAAQLAIGKNPRPPGQDRRARGTVAGRAVRQFVGQDHSGTAPGTPQFMSPEHAAERLDLIGPATDIYGLSATLDGVLTGWLPFVESDAVPVLPRCGGSSRNPRRVNRRVPRPLDAVCLKAMARDPNSASPAATALADASSTGWPMNR